MNRKIVSLENVRNVLFGALLLDNVTVENGLFHAQMCTDYAAEINVPEGFDTGINFVIMALNRICPKEGLYETKSSFTGI